MNSCNHNRLPRQQPPRRSGQFGFTLIEVLVAVIVLSIGLVGVAGLQAVSLKNNQSAFMRSQASALAYDLADRMRANVPGANAGMYDPTAKAATAGCKSTSGCTTQQMAENDLAEWSAAIATYLPDGEGFVCIDSTPNDGTGIGDPQCDGTGTLFAVKIWWDDDRDGTINITPTNTERLAITIQL
ncbi:MAG: type IV pilus modification protein PilV [Gammaproteobacteria bacterium]|nr:type IV pilus modification protein PilV [Gammaproteobacteria bacterium]